MKLNLTLFALNLYLTYCRIQNSISVCSTQVQFHNLISVQCGSTVWSSASAIFRCESNYWLAHVLVSNLKCPSVLKPCVLFLKYLLPSNSSRFFNLTASNCLSVENAETEFCIFELKEHRVKFSSWLNPISKHDFQIQYDNSNLVSSCTNLSVWKRQKRKMSTHKTEWISQPVYNIKHHFMRGYIIFFIITDNTFNY